VPTELRDFRWALIAAQHRSLRQAAETLHVRQSTLSRRLRDIEAQLGANLFERTNGGTRPTIEGQEFLLAARRIVEEADSLAARMKTRSRGESGRLVIGVHTSLSAGNLRATLTEHHRLFPDVQTDLVDGSSAHLISELASSGTDVAFIATSDFHWNGKSLPVWSERLVAAIPQGHPLSSQDIIHWNDIRYEPILLPLRGPGAEFLKLVVGKIGCPGSGKVRQHDVSLDRLLTLVGVGTGIMLALEGATGVTYPGVTFREVHDGDGPTRLSFHAAWREENINPSLHRFLTMLRERYPDLSADPASR
jgi:DNA-binding transcriptional LysR family regulator